MASSKAALKAIKASLDGDRFEQAADQAENLLKQDNKNHTALLFLGFAREKLGDLDAAEKAIHKAADCKPQDVQAYKGLITLYEKQGSPKVDQYHDVAFKLAEIYAQQEDRAQCQNVIDKYELFAKKHGTRPQYRRALELILPTSIIYPVLEGRVMQPNLAYQRILESAEAEEKEWINTQIGERRTRLGAKIDQVTRQVKAEAISQFRVEEKYAALIDWTRDDDARHDLEQKLFQRMYDNLLAVPPEAKQQQRDKVLNMANGMVIIKQPFRLAWKVALEWVDAENLEDWDVNIFREYIGYFPDDGLSRILKGFLDSDFSPFPQPVEDPTDEEGKIEKLNDTDRLILMNEGLEDCPESLLGHRIMASTYMHHEDWFSTVDVARKAQNLHKEAEQRYALDLQDSIDGVNLILADALIHHQSPRCHPEAKALFQEVLRRKPKLTAALLGVGLIFEEDENYPEAVKFLHQAAERDPDNVRIKLELAWCRAQNGELDHGLQDLHEILSVIESNKQPDLSMKSVVLYRIAWCQWHLNTSVAARKDKSGPYQYLIASVKANPSYAPAYTLLGIYFQDYGKGRQSQERARVALQKAFELSTSELEAAHRLAKAFADTAEWDLVELVARRVVASGKARPPPGSKKKAYSWPFAALGVVQTNNQQYSQSIVSFQAALRIAPTDYYSWVGLGESYHNAGRHVAATRAFAKADGLDHGLPPGETWFAKYMLANVQREMGLFEEAIKAYKEVLMLKPEEFGVLLALLQTISESAWAHIALGMFGEAVKLANSAIEVASNIAKNNVQFFNLWKAVGDACSVLGHVKSSADAASLEPLSSLLQLSLGSELEILADVDKVSLDTLKTSEGDSHTDTARRCLYAAVLAHKRAVHACSGDQHAQAVAWYNLGWAEHQAYISGGEPMMADGKKPRRFLKAAIKCFKRAIELEASNSEFWNALGVATMTLSPQISQHSFVRSLHLGDHSARTWTNLGVLYLVHGDHQLANEAYTRAQSEDPEYADAWVGQGLLALLFGSLGEARGLFMHAFEIADSSLLPPKRHYAMSAFDFLLKDPSRSQEVGVLLQPLFAMRQYRTLQPSDTIATRLMALLAERAGDHATSVKVLQEVCDAVEAEYEKSESNEYLVKFAQAKADLARAQLACGNYSDAVSNAETALDLSGEADDFGPIYAESRRKWRLSAHVSAGLAHSHLHNIDESINMFQAALEEPENQPDIVCMLAQVLWAKGGSAEKDAARSQLFDVIENNPQHVDAIALLAAMGLLDYDEDVLEAVQEDLKALRRGDEIGVLDKKKVTKILAGLVGCRPKDAQISQVDQVAVIADALNGIMLAPGQPQGWLELSQAAEDEDARIYAAEMAVLNASRQIPPGGRLEADDLANVFVGTGQTEDLLRAKMLAPWKMEIDCGAA
ncbi:Superkiller protein 3 [Exophiala xenobiotica]|nr:Superkiller protein 3 [Exophiala xenobiotica]KAK5226682.1 Superkiller protein 3 [Exophiala xenobiotica]KAK5252738.1 Superkiller protein 3 [Exophiala xenobiotica]KAK5284329.1 Superkiller protein 3 [Exophiala xenobiotica]KAK5348969.1 Superkiller protein 3 [Exophiala xenobiotica]